MSISNRHEGTVDDPLALVEMVTEARIAPGDTVYLRGGVYEYGGEQLVCSLAGTEHAPIIIRNYPGETAYIDARLVQQGNYVTWMSDDYGLVIFSPDTNRISEQPGSDPTDVQSHGGFSIEANGVNLINIRLHDFSGTGIHWMGARPGIVYGVIIDNNGWIGPDRSHGPGIYTHDSAGVGKQIENTLILNSFRYALQCYSDSTGGVNNYSIVDVTSSSGAVFNSNYGCVDDLVITRLWTTGSYPQFGGGHYPYHGKMIASNLISNGSYAFSLRYFSEATINGGRFYAPNTILDEHPDGSAYDLNSNDYGTLSGVDANLVPNIYAPRFATLTVYDWDETGSVEIDVAVLLVSGMVRVRNPMLWDTEYVDLMVTDGKIALQMTGWTTPPPTGFDEPIRPVFSARFGVFILEKLT